jgi:hypothetical protein
MFGVDFAALTAIAKYIQDQNNAVLKNNFDNAYGAWLARKTWGKPLENDPMPMPPPSVVITVNMDGMLIVSPGPLVAPVPQPEKPKTETNPIGALIYGSEYDATEYGDTFPSGYQYTAPDGARYIKVKRPNPFAGDGDSDSWFKLG